MNKAIEEQINTLWLDFADEVNRIIQRPGESDDHKYFRIRDAFNYTIKRVREMEEEL